VLDIANIQKELEIKIKEKNDADFFIMELKKENEINKQLYSDLNGKKMMIIESLEKGITELEEAKSKVKELENEKNELIIELDKSKEFNEKIIYDYKNILEKLNEAEKNNTEFVEFKNEVNLKNKENKKLVDGKYYKLCVFDK